MSVKRYQPKEHILAQLKKLPELPGVYLMKDARGEVIYVGKSKQLKKRVSSYFQRFDAHLPKTKTMVVNIDRFDYLVTDSEAEALVLEANLIKQYQPRFNVLLKDDKMYPYIVITKTEKFPRIIYTRNLAHYPKAKVYGPYVSAEQVYQFLELIHTIFPLRECQKNVGIRVERPCLNYHIGRCAAPCAGKITEAMYRSYVDQVEQLLHGNKEWLVRRLIKEMNEHAKALSFEQAAKARDGIRALEGLNIRQKVIQNNKKNQDYIAGVIQGKRSCAMLFQYRDGKLIGREEFTFIHAEASTISELLFAFVQQYYTGKTAIPSEIYLSHAIPHQKMFESLFTSVVGQRVQMNVPQKGDKRKTILLVEKNAEEYLNKFEKRIQRQIEKEIQAEAQLKELLGIGENLPIKRLEAFDISNISGVYAVGSMVTFEHSKKKRTDYRRYRIKSVEGPDDYASMQEIIFRRYRDKKNDLLVLPDLILIDGGKGHVNAAQQVLDALNIHVPVAGMVKDDFHKTDDLVYNGSRVGLKNFKQAFRLIYDIQEEVHRFAISYHKTLRSKEMLHSELDDIPYIGEKRKIALLKSFQTIEAIRAASIDELQNVDGVDKRAATSIYHYYHKKDDIT